MRISTLAVVPLATALFGCPSSTPPKSRPLAEEPFTLSPKAPEAPAEAADDTPPEVPQPASEPTEVPEPAAVVADAGARPSACPHGKLVPPDFDVAVAPQAAGADAGAAAPGELHLTVTNRGMSVRVIQVADLDLLVSSPSGRGWSKASPVPIRRVALEEGSGGATDAKVNVLPKATVRVVVEFEPEAAPAPGRRGARLHFTVDDKRACFEASMPRR